jgi:hypothetical protein
VPPRIGLRWVYLAENSGGASSGGDGGTGPAPVRFRVQIVDSLGTPYVRTETREQDIRVTLPPETPPGIYYWWVESVPDHDTTAVSVSARESFRIG